MGFEQLQPGMRRVRWDLWVGPLLAALTVAAYLPACHNGFVYDDDLYVVHNPHVQAGLTRDGVRWALSATAATNWHPLTWLSLQLDYNLYGRGLPWSDHLAAGYHLTNILIHAAAVALLFAVLRGMTGAVWRSAAVAALFAVHPLRVESVAWASERKDVLCALFGVAAVGAYARYARRPGVLRYLAVAALFALGLLSKPMLVTLPCALLLLDYWPLRRWRGAPPDARREGSGPDVPPPPQHSLAWLLGEKLPLLLLSAGVSVATWMAQQQGQAIQPLERFPLDVRIGNALVSYLVYLGKTFWPVHLAALYPHAGLGLPWGQAAAAAGVLAAVSAVAFKLARRFPYLVVGWLWYLGVLLPVIGLTQAGPQAHADRFTYLPHIGLIIALVWGTADLAGRFHVRPVAAALAVGAVAGCTLLTLANIPFWHDNVALWEHALDVTTGNAFAHLNLAAALAERGKDAEAIRHYRAALDIDPGDWHARYRLAALLMQQGDEEEARGQFAVARRLQPDNHAIVAAYAQTLNARGKELAAQGREDEALHHFVEAMTVLPDYRPARRNLTICGKAYARRGRWADAAACYRALADADHRDASAAYLLAYCLRQQGKAAGAESSEAGSRGADWPSAAAKEAWGLATDPEPDRRDGAWAVCLAEAACQATCGGDARMRDVLAAAYAEAGRFEQAQAACRSALQRVSDPDQAREIRTRLRLYQRGRAFHATE